MQLLLETWTYIAGHQPDFWAKTGAHLTLSGVALLAALMIAFPLGILSAQSRGASQAVTNGIGALRAIPSLAIMAAMLPLIGVGFRPALIALTILAIPPMLINTQAGIMAVNPAITEAARGMGLSRWQIIGQVQLPLALPVIVTGVRIASVEVIASATLGAIIGAGGLGEYIFAGLSLGPAYLHLMLVGAITVALLTLTAEVSLNRLEVVVRHAFHQ
ncbi:MAG: ABC transporter permease [Anaerolineae bacterium]|jgi:osmoprotectant transport system permease protein|uniref:ABC transporter permease n=1 Tax=Candidatus Amarolinea dominans TaxID=3140696 RepID=UPI001D9975BF|nr:ABC transporter permease [Anaerolineae bacterium]MBK7200952.1 ABC transporter permease [Anaerolineae bacterium]MBK9091729.1 ABC transporter permease [Anaerolineae bacterium]MBK9231957.1 ABC transporter permease [Anaerolineae bacterium]